MLCRGVLGTLRYSGERSYLLTESLSLVFEIKTRDDLSGGEYLHVSTQRYGDNLGLGV